MSGFLHGDHGPYELTPTQVGRWHGGRLDGCHSTDEMIDRHVRPTFAVEDKRSSWVVTHPTLEAGSTNLLFTLLSGHESNQAPLPGRAVP